MPRYALINYTTNRVDNVIEDVEGRNLEPLGEHFLYASPICNVGDVWNGYTLDPYVAPEPEPVLYKTFTKLEFRNLFTLAERIELDNFETNATLSESHKKTLRTLHKDQEAASYIDLNRTDTQQGIQYLAVAGLISAERVVQILAATNTHDASV